jgi:glucose/arabinose dehydrogenase
MSAGKKFTIATLVLVLVAIFAVTWLARGDRAELSVLAVSGVDPVLDEPEAETIPTIRIATPIGWNESAVPVAAPGLTVSRFAEGLDHPRVIHTLPNGDVLVTLTRAPEVASGADDAGLFARFRNWIAARLMASAGAGGVSADTLLLLRDSDGDGTADQRHVLTDELASPSGIAWREGVLLVANHDALLSIPYRLGQTDIDLGEARRLMELPGGGGHWMRNIELSPDGERLYIAVGSVSNIGEEGLDVEAGRAMIWEYDLASDRPRPFATGLRNPNGLDFSPWTGELWTTVNERDLLGSDLVPDYLTNVPVGAHYGWPWFYWGDIIDRRVDAPMPRFLAEYVRTPEYALGPHVAALGFVFSEEGHRLGAPFGSGAVIARHGSWNRKPPSGYDVVYVEFDARGNPVGKPRPVLTGFLTAEGDARGRPTWVEWAEDGALLVSDDTAGIIWRVIDENAEPAAAIERLQSDPLPPRRSLEGDPRAQLIEQYAREQMDAR